MSLKLTQNYYKTESPRIQGYDSKGWWFTGGTSFMSNGYVIYTNGLDGWPPNPTAIAQGRTYESRLFDQRSMDQRSSYYQFTSQLRAIANRAAANEKRYLEIKLQQLRQSEIDVNYLDKIEQAINEEDYNSAYTLLLRRDKDLKELQREISSNRNRSFSKTNEFFNSQFYKFIADKFEAQLASQTGQYGTVSIDTDFDKLVDEYFSEALNISFEDNKSLEYIRQQFIDGLKKLTENSDGKIYESVFLEKAGEKLKHHKNNTKKVKRDQWLTKAGEFRTPKEIARRLAYTLISNIGRGLSTEAFTIGSFEGIGASALSAGNVKYNRTNLFTGAEYKNIQQRNDAIVFEAYEATINTDQIIQDTASEYDELNRDFYDEVERRIKQIAEGTGVGEFFEIAVSVKGYISDHDLTIAGEGSFSNRMSDIKQLKLDGNMVNKLIFMLNNTTQGCIMAGRQLEIEDYLAAVCVAWMWDNSDEIFDLEAKGPSNFRKIHLFNSGGAYFTASQIIQQTLDRLINYGEDNNRFVNVNITPPAAYGNYNNLMNKYSTQGIQSKDEWQAQLQKRWDAVKAEAMESGSISITFNQAELNELLGNLKGILEVS